MKPVPVRLLLVSTDAALASALGRLLKPLYALAASAALQIDGAKLVLLDEPDAGLIEAASESGLPVIVLARAGDETVPQGGPRMARVEKPVRMPVLLAELDRMRRQEDRAAAVAFGQLRYLKEERLLIHEGAGPSVRLTEKEAALLSELLEAGGSAVSREALLKRVWGHAEGVMSHTLETHIYRLRRKLKDGAGLIRHGEGGYRIEA